MVTLVTKKSVDQTPKNNCGFSADLDMKDGISLIIGIYLDSTNSHIVSKSDDVNREMPTEIKFRFM